MQWMGQEAWSVKQMMQYLELKDRENFIEKYLNPAIGDGLVRMLYPQSPRHPKQKYLLTERGKARLDES